MFAAELEGLLVAEVRVAVTVVLGRLVVVVVVSVSAPLPPSWVGGGPGTAKEPKSELR